jgi:hypothetical protein
MKLEHWLLEQLASAPPGASEGVKDMSIRVILEICSAGISTSTIVFPAIAGMELSEYFITMLVGSTSELL